MSLLRKISGLFAGNKRGDRSGSLEVAAQCLRCGEIIRARVDLAHDLSAEYGDDGQESDYLCRKVLIGKEGCYAPVEIVLHFDAGRNLINRQ